MKKVLIAIAVIIVILVASPKFIGSKFKQGIENSVASLNEAPGYKASIVSLDSGWFNTESVIKIAIDIPLADENSELDLSIDFNVKGHHGPLISADGFSIGALKTKIETINNNLLESVEVEGGEPLYQFTALTNLFGSSSYQDATAPFVADFQVQQMQFLIEFDGMKGEGSFSNKHFEGSSKGEPLLINVGDGMFVVNIGSFNVATDSQASLFTMLEGALYDSMSSFDIDSITIENNIDGTQNMMKTIAFEAISELDESAELGNIFLITDIAEIQTADLSITELELDLELKNLQTAFFQAYNEFSNSILLESDTEVIAQATTDFFSENLLPQLQAEPEYNFTKIYGKLDGNEFSGKMLTKLTGVTELPATLEDPMFWKQHAEVDSQLNIQKDAAVFIAKQALAMQMAANPNFLAMPAEQQDALLEQQAAPTLMMLAQQGMLVENENDYEVIFTLISGVATLNGNPIPL